MSFATPPMKWTSSTPSTVRLNFTTSCTFCPSIAPRCIDCREMGTTEEQLVSFFLHSMFVYPVTNYLVSHNRSYARWKGACYAIMFLAMISTCHVVRFSRPKTPLLNQLNSMMFTNICTQHNSYMRIAKRVQTITTSLAYLVSVPQFCLKRHTEYFL